MIGLEYVLNLYNMEHQSLAEKLGIRKQNINLWIKGKQKISKKHLPILSDIFGIEEDYFQRELDDVDKLIIQKEKLRRDIDPQVVKYDQDLQVGYDADIVEKPIYDKEEFNKINEEIEKAKLIEEFREIVADVNNPNVIKLLSQISLILRNHKNDSIFEYTIDSLSHYYNVLPDWVGEPESDMFVEKFLELATHYDKKSIGNE
ncbi:helix-turn-helix domain-containing protein [Bacillus weihaiensis]|uniref:helix-turn-helix domain-containing protein n=1 Tax=Bacillus weihaiensis TaxID=1547283 RepID=UPI002355C09C|nr:helix-turn-helix transcriptional regulator [Bacillus weihaiensis]